MATVTRPPRSLPAPAPVEPQQAPAPNLDPFRPHYGDRVAFAIWLTCALFMAALLAYDTIMGLLR
jgi:hypothetical protein